MARIRAFKIGFFTNEHLCDLGPFHRLLFAGLWLLADKDGRLEDRPRRIAVQLFPFDRDLDVNAMLTDLSTAQFISRYVVEDGKFIQVLNFTAHQRPHHAEPVSVIPPEADKSPVKHRRSPLGREGKGREGKGTEEGKGREGEAACAALRDLWNLKCGDLPKCQELTEARKRSGHQRLNDRPFEQWIAVVDRIAGSDFCNGKNDRQWVATFDWLIKPETAVKVLEGKYDNRSPRPKTLGPTYAPDDWFEDCKRLHGGACNGRYAHAQKMDVAS